MALRPKKLGYGDVSSGADVIFSFGDKSLKFEKVRRPGESLEGLGYDRYTYEELWKIMVKHRHNIEVSKDDIKKFPNLSVVIETSIQRMEVAMKCIEEVLLVADRLDHPIKIQYV